MQNGAVTMENSMEIPLKSKNRITTWSSSPTLGVYQEEKSGSQMNTPVFVTVLFTIAKRWEKPKCLWKMNG